MKERKGFYKRIAEVLDYFENIPPGEKVGQQDIMNDLHLLPGQWNQLKQWLDTIIYIQNHTKVKREFIPNSTGKSFVTVYSRDEDNDTVRDDKH